MIALLLDLENSASEIAGIIITSVSYERTYVYHNAYWCRNSSTA